MGTIKTNVIYSKQMGIDWNYTYYEPEYAQKTVTNLLIMLHGATGNHTNFNLNTDLLSRWETMRQDTLVVYVDGMNSFYMDGPAIPMESMILEDLIPFLKTMYPGIKTMDIAGISMGGYGALRLALRHPDLFENCYAVAPAVWEHMTATTETGTWHIFIDEHHEMDPKVWDAMHPRQFIQAMKTKFWVETGALDEIVPYNEVELFVSQLAEKCDVVYQRIDHGAHEWPYFSPALHRVLSQNYTQL